MTLRVKESGLISSGPPCSSFVFINMSTSGRRKTRPLGLASLRPYVKMANRKLIVQVFIWNGQSFYTCSICTFRISTNTFILSNWLQHFLGWNQLRITTRMVLLWLLATVRFVFLITEQPLSSLMTFFPYVIYFKKMVQTLFQIAYFDVTLSGSYCEWYTKHFGVGSGVAKFHCGHIRRNRAGCFPHIWTQGLLLRNEHTNQNHPNIFSDMDQVRFHIFWSCSQWFPCVHR